MANIPQRPKTKTLAPMFETDREIVYFGLKRSGHHAVINWQIMHSGCDLIFINNLRKNDTLQHNISKAMRLENSAAYQIRSDGDADIQSVLQRHWPLLIYNLESAGFAEAEDYRVIREHDRHVRSAHGLEQVLVLRDPLNNFASLARRRRAFRQKRIRHWTHVWMEHASGLMNSPSDITDSSGRLVIRFAAWNLDPVYREVIAEKLQLTGSNLPERVTQQGGGSSFSGKDDAFLGDRSVLLKRWQAMTDRPEFFLFFRDAAFAEQAKRYYRTYPYPEGMTEAVDELHRRAVSFSRIAAGLHFVRRAWPKARRT